MACLFRLLSIFSYPPVPYTLWLCSGWLWEVNSALCCRALELLEKVAFLSVVHEWNGSKHIFCQQLLWIFGGTGIPSLKTPVSFTPYWEGFLMCASAVPKPRVNGSRSCLRSAPPSFLRAITTQMLFFVFIVFVEDGLHTAWVCKSGVCPSEERIFADFFSETNKQVFWQVLK